MPKHILLITTDQHRWDYLGYMGQPAMQGLTPNLDRLAASGAAFEHCFTPNPLCMPARHAMQSGLYTFQSGQMANVGDWPLDFPTFPQVLQCAGYHTVLTGKLHAHEAVGSDIDLTEDPWAAEVRTLGFDEVTQVSGKSMAFHTDDDYTTYLRERDMLYAYREDLVLRAEARAAGRSDAWSFIFDEEHYIDSFIGRTAEAWLRDYAGEQPFLHIVSFCSPHTPFDAPQRAIDAVDPERVVLPPHNAEAERLRETVINYAAQIHHVDEQIGKLLNVLEDRGRLAETLILFTADHGEMLGDVEQWGKCGWLDSSIRVPLLVHYPEWTHQRRVIETMASCHDIAATVLDFALGSDVGTRALPGASAVSLKPFLTGAGTAVRDAVYSENGGQFGRPWRLMDDGAHRYVWLLDTDEELLFDRHADPYCLTNLAADPAASQALEALRHAMLRAHVTHPSPKTCRAAYTPGVSHGLSREKLRPATRIGEDPV